MLLLGSVVNGLSVLAGGAAGLVIRKGFRKVQAFSGNQSSQCLPGNEQRKPAFSDKIGETIMSGLALCVLYIGIQGALKGEKVLITIISMAVGSLIGVLIDLDRRINQLGDWLQQKLGSSDDTVSVSQGFVTASLLFCVGAMGIVGSLQSGMTGNNETLFTKSLIDGISAIVLASSFGYGVLLSGGLVFLYEGAITMLSTGISPYLSTNVVNEMTCVGSLLIIGISLNMLKITKLPIMNYVLSVFLPILLCTFM